MAEEYDLIEAMKDLREKWYRQINDLVNRIGDRAGITIERKKDEDVYRNRETGEEVIAMKAYDILLRQTGSSIDDELRREVPGYDKLIEAVEADEGDETLGNLL